MRKSMLVMASMALFSMILLSACGTKGDANDAAHSEGGAAKSSAPSSTASSGSSTGGSDSHAAPAEPLRIITANVGGKTPEEMKLFEQELKKLSGIDAAFDRPASDYGKKVAAALSSGDNYDLIEESDLGTLASFIQQGIPTDLTDFVENSKALSDPNVIPSSEWDQLKGPDGKIYAVFSKYQGGTMPIVRQDWLDKLHLQQPKTLDDYYQVLKAFKEQDPDGDNKADTYGLSTAGMYDVQGFFTANGVEYKYVVKDGKRTIPFATDAAVPIYEWFAKLYMEGILDPNFVTNDTGKMRNLFLTDRVGMITYWDAWVGMFNNMRKQQDANTAFQAVGLPGVAGPDGQYNIRRGDPDFWIIPANAKHKETAEKFLEFWNTKPGIILGSLGIEGNDYTVDANGKYKLTDIGTQHNMDHGVPFWYNTTFEAPFPKLPGVQPAQDLETKYGHLQVSLPEWSDAQKIVDAYAMKAMSGQMDAKEAVKKMHDELMAAHLIDE